MPFASPCNIKITPASAVARTVAALPRGAGVWLTVDVHYNFVLTTSRCELPYAPVLRLFNGHKRTTQNVTTFNTWPWLTSPEFASELKTRTTRVEATERCTAASINSLVLPNGWLNLYTALKGRTVDELRST